MRSGKSSFYGPTVFLSFLGGALAGATAVLLLAPKARRESADRMKSLSIDLKERASTSIDTAKEKLSSAVSRLRDALDERHSVIGSAVEAGQESFVTGKDRAAEADRPRA